VQVTNEATDIYMWGPRLTEFHRCKHCGCVTHWALADKTRDRALAMGESADRMGVNARLMAPEVLARVRVRHLDGADTWKYLDE
jgi:hypothetical protein